MNRIRSSFFAHWLAFVAAALLIGTPALHAQVTVRNPITVDSTNKRVNDSFKIPSGKTVTQESGSTLTLSSGSQLTLSSGSTLSFFGASVNNAANMRTALSLVPGTDIMALDTELVLLASLTAAADRLPYFTGAGSASLATFTAAGRALLDDADAAAQRTTLGLAIGTNVQAYDADLTTLAGSSAFFLSLADDADAATARTTLGLAIGTNVQAYDADLTTLAGSSAFFLSLADDADAATARATLKAKNRRTILVVGNSISTTVSPATTNWVSILGSMAEFADDVIVNEAVGGEELNQTISNYATRVTPYIPATTGRPLIVFLPCAAGVDVYNGTSAATAWSRIQSFVDSVQADGGKVVIGTVAPGSAFGGASETRRTDLNALIVAGRSDYDYYWPMHLLYPDKTGAFFTTDDQHTSNFGAAVMARDALNAWRGLYDYGVMLPPTLVMTNGLTLQLNDASTAGVTISNVGGATFADEVQLSGITGGFGSGGLWFDSTVRMGVLSSTLFLRMPTGGFEIYNSSTGQAYQFSDAGRLGLPSLKVGGTVGGSGTEIKSIISGSASLNYGNLTSGSEETLTITVTGVATTSTPSVQLGWSAALEDGIVVKQAWVSASNTVSVRVRNVSGGDVNPAAVTCRATVTSF